MSNLKNTLNHFFKSSTEYKTRLNDICSKYEEFTKYEIDTDSDYDFNETTTRYRYNSNDSSDSEESTETESDDNSNETTDQEADLFFEPKIKEEFKREINEEYLLKVEKLFNETNACIGNEENVDAESIRTISDEEEEDDDVIIQDDPYDEDKDVVIFSGSDDGEVEENDGGNVDTDNSSDSNGGTDNSSGKTGDCRGSSGNTGGSRGSKGGYRDSTDEDDSGDVNTDYDGGGGNDNSKKNNTNVKGKGAYKAKGDTIINMLSAGKDLTAPKVNKIYKTPGSSKQKKHSNKKTTSELNSTFTLQVEMPVLEQHEALDLRVVSCEKGSGCHRKAVDARVDTGERCLKVSNDQPLNLVKKSCEKRVSYGFKSKKKLVFPNNDREDNLNTVTKKFNKALQNHEEFSKTTDLQVSSLNGTFCLDSPTTSKHIATSLKKKKMKNYEKNDGNKPDNNDINQKYDFDSKLKCDANNDDFDNCLGTLHYSLLVRNLERRINHLENLTSTIKSNSMKSTFNFRASCYSEKSSFGKFCKPFLSTNRNKDRLSCHSLSTNQRSPASFTEFFRLSSIQPKSKIKKNTCQRSLDYNNNNNISNEKNDNFSNNYQNSSHNKNDRDLSNREHNKVNNKNIINNNHNNNNILSLIKSSIRDINNSYKKSIINNNQIKSNNRHHSKNKKTKNALTKNKNNNNTINFTANHTKRTHKNNITNTLNKTVSLKRDLFGAKTDQTNDVDNITLFDDIYDSDDFNSVHRDVDKLTIKHIDEETTNYSKNPTRNINGNASSVIPSINSNINNSKIIINTFDNKKYCRDSKAHRRYSQHCNSIKHNRVNNSISDVKNSGILQACIAYSESGDGYARDKNNNSINNNKNNINNNNNKINKKRKKSLTSLSLTPIKASFSIGSFNCDIKHNESNPDSNAANMVIADGKFTKSNNKYIEYNANNKNNNGNSNNNKNNNTETHDVGIIQQIDNGVENDEEDGDIYGETKAGDIEDRNGLRKEKASNPTMQFPKRPIYSGCIGKEYNFGRVKKLKKFNRTGSGVISDSLRSLKIKSEAKQVSTLHSNQESNSGSSNKSSVHPSDGYTSVETLASQFRDITSMNDLLQKTLPTPPHSINIIEIKPIETTAPSPYPPLIPPQDKPSLPEPPNPLEVFKPPHTPTLQTSTSQNTAMEHFKPPHPFDTPNNQPPKPRTRLNTPKNQLPHKSLKPQTPLDTPSIKNTSRHSSKSSDFWQGVEMDYEVDMLVMDEDFLKLRVIKQEKEHNITIEKKTLVTSTNNIHNNRKNKNKKNDLINNNNTKNNNNNTKIHNSNHNNNINGKNNNNISIYSNLIDDTDLDPMETDCLIIDAPNFEKNKNNNKNKINSTNKKNNNSNNKNKKKDFTKLKKEKDNETKYVKKHQGKSVNNVVCKKAAVSTVVKTTTTIMNSSINKNHHYNNKNKNNNHQHYLSDNKIHNNNNDHHHKDRNKVDDRKPEDGKGTGTIDLTRKIKTNNKNNNNKDHNHTNVGQGATKRHKNSRLRSLRSASNFKSPTKKFSFCDEDEEEDDGGGDASIYGEKEEGEDGVFRVQEDLIGKRPSDKDVYNEINTDNSNILENANNKENNNNKNNKNNNDKNNINNNTLMSSNTNLSNTKEGTNVITDGTTEAYNNDNILDTLILSGTSFDLEAKNNHPFSNVCNYNTNKNNNSCNNKNDKSYNNNNNNGYNKSTLLDRNKISNNKNNDNNKNNHFNNDNNKNNHFNNDNNKNNSHNSKNNNSSDSIKDFVNMMNAISDDYSGREKENIQSLFVNNFVPLKRKKSKDFLNDNKLKRIKLCK